MHTQNRVTRSDTGFSVIELLVVVLLIGIMSTVALFYAFAHKEAYEPDDQSLQINDILQEARQRALTQRRAMRVEINLTTNAVSLYDENANSTTADDDVLLKRLKLFAVTNVRVEGPPDEITYNPPEPFPVADAIFKPSIYPPSLSQNVCTIRFLASGKAVDAGTSAIGTGATPTGVSLHVWSPTKANPDRSDIARAITILGATGVIRLWEFDRTSTAPNKWKDSRRSGSYGG